MSGETAVADPVQPGSLNPILDKIAALRTEAAAEPKPPELPPPDDPSVRAATQDRDPSTGRFQSKDQLPGTADGAPSTDTDDAAAAEAVPEPPAEDADAEVRPEDDALDAPPEDRKAAEDEAWLTVQLPSRREGEDPIEIELDDPEAVERIKQLTNGYARAEQVRQERHALEEQRQDWEIERREFTDDPAGWMSANVHHPQMKADVVLALMADDHVYEAVTERLDAWASDPNQRVLDRAQIENRRLSTQLQRQQEAARVHQSREAARAVHGAIYAMIPEDAADPDIDAFVKYAIQDLTEHARSNRAAVRPTDVPKIIEALHRRFWPNGSTVPGGTPGSKTPGAPNRPAKGSKAPAARDVGEEVRTARARQRVVAASPAGAGGGAAQSMRPPKGVGVEGAIEWARKRLAQG